MSAMQKLMEQTNDIAKYLNSIAALTRDPMPSALADALLESVAMVNAEAEAKHPEPVVYHLMVQERSLAEGFAERVVLGQRRNRGVYAFEEAVLTLTSEATLTSRLDALDLRDTVRVEVYLPERRGEKEAAG